MPFCTYCGKKLEDGEVCSCRQPAVNGTPNETVSPYTANPYEQPQETYAQPRETYAQPQQQAAAEGSTAAGAEANVMTPIIELAKETMKKPITAAEEFYRKEAVVPSAILLGALTFLYWAAFMAHKLPAAIRTATVYGAGQIVASVILPLIYMIVMAGVTVGLIYLVNAIFIKGKVEIKKVLCFGASVTLPLAAASLIELVRLYIPLAGLRMPFTILVYACGILTLLQGLNIMAKEVEERKKLVPGMIVMVGGLYLADWILCLIFGNVFYYSFFSLPF